MRDLRRTVLLKNSACTIRRFLNGSAVCCNPIFRCSAITLCAIAEHFDVPVSELYYGAKDDEPLPVVINVKKRRPIIALIAGLSVCLVISVIFAVLGIAGVFGKKDVMYTVTVNGETISVKENTFYSPEKPERAGYDFAGWRDKGGNEIDFPMKIDGNLEIESFFTPHEYTIDYWLNGGALRLDVSTALRSAQHDEKE